MEGRRVASVSAQGTFNEQLRRQPVQNLWWTIICCPLKGRLKAWSVGCLSCIRGRQIMHVKNLTLPFIWGISLSGSYFLNL